ncbi:hypothetical protein H6P81_013262 [Aristolochia fimbriata]|uniref:Methyltransferase n=1 Tax=Aristolochia fimbriata TaxID=158543 RepID=A0AAV7EER4_ARIFI|nr:hypothetical protein H6P81_013262 [Aristolochia fimbriata]
MPSFVFPGSLCRRRLAVAVLVAGLCSFCYYVGLYNNIQSLGNAKAPDAPPNCLQFNFSKTTTKTPTVVFDFEPHHRSPSLPSNPSTHLPALELCPENFTHYCPCQDLTRMKRFFEKGNVVYKERHCPGKEEVVRCLIPKPRGYRTPFPWPASRDVAWFPNVPFKTLTETKGSQNWVRLEGRKLVFPGGGTSFQAGVKGYVEQIRRFVPLKKGTIRTVLDIGCGSNRVGAE